MDLVDRYWTMDGCVFRAPCGAWRAGREMGMLEDYRKARKLGLKQIQRDVAAGNYPYPPALDDILKGQGYQGEIPMGLAEIDIALIAGTKTRGRQNTFSREFMPLPESSSEFASKWSDLIDSQRVEGLHEPIIVYEFMQRFYVQEGNKRVSVMRFLKMPTILAKITRVVPMPSGTKSFRIYQEFTQFYNAAPIYGIVFSEEGSYAKLAALVDKPLNTPWPEEDVRDLRSVFDSFNAAFTERGGNRLGLTAGDAFLIFLKIYQYSKIVHATPDEIAGHVARVWNEFVVSRDGGKVAYLEHPSPSKPKIIPELKSVYKDVLRAKPFRAAFIYEFGPLTSGWTALHERGRTKLEQKLGATISTRAFLDCIEDDDFDLAVEEAAHWKADLVVTVSPTQMRQAMRGAVAHPEISFINCSVSLSHSAVRTFSGRLYEAKFLLGALAASMADNHKIGYVADTPVFGSVSEINAFAIGAAMIDPHAIIYLKWFTAKDYDWKRELAEEDVRIVSGRDYHDPLFPNEAWGLYRIEHDGTTTHLAEPVWKWGRYYELIVQSIRNDTWNRERDIMGDQALNYWWGMSAGILDVNLSASLPFGQRRLVEIIRQSMLTGRTEPFVGDLIDQDGTVQHTGEGRLSSEEIVRMRWLNANVIGRLPEQRELSQDGLEQVEVSGLIPLDPTTLPHRGTAS